MYSSSLFFLKKEEPQATNNDSLMTISIHRSCCLGRQNLEFATRPTFLHLLSGSPCLHSSCACTIVASGGLGGTGVWIKANDSRGQEVWGGIKVALMWRPNTRFWSFGNKKKKRHLKCSFADVSKSFCFFSCVRLARQVALRSRWNCSLGHTKCWGGINWIKLDLGWAFTKGRSGSTGQRERSTAGGRRACSGQEQTARLRFFSSINSALYSSWCAQIHCHSGPIRRFASVL